MYEDNDYLLKVNHLYLTKCQKFLLLTLPNHIYAALPQTFDIFRSVHATAPLLPICALNCSWKTQHILSIELFCYFGYYYWNQYYKSVSFNASFFTLCTLWIGFVDENLKWSISIYFWNLIIHEVYKYTHMSISAHVLRHLVGSLTENKQLAWFPMH